MPTIDVSDEQRAFLRALRDELQSEVQYGSVREQDALQYLIDHFEGGADLDVARTDVDADAVGGDDASADGGAVAATPDPAGGGDAVESLVAAETRVVLFGTGESPAESFGETDAFEPVEEGTALETENTVFVMPGDRVIPDEAIPKADLFDAGVAAPLSGATFTMSVLSTPDASVLGQSANPLVGLDTDALLEREETQRLLDRAGVTDADSIEWLAGPTRIDVDGGNVSLLGEASASGVESFAAVLSGAAGPWLVFAHVVRVTTDDHVVVLGLHRRAIGTPEGAGDLAALGETASVQYGRELVRQAVERLEGS